MPTALAEVAAPIQKLWVLYFELSKPAFLSVAERRALNCALVSGAQLSEMNNKPGAFPQIAR